MVVKLTRGLTGDFLPNSNLFAHERPDCPNCGIPAMRLVSFKRDENYQYQRTFSCLGCSHLTTLAVQASPAPSEPQHEQQPQSKLKDQ